MDYGTSAGLGLWLGLGAVPGSISIIVAPEIRTPHFTLV